jgi:hypothetical protein
MLALLTAVRCDPHVARSQALEYFTFTMVAEPVIRLVHGIQQAKVKRSFNPKQVVSCRFVASPGSSNAEGSARYNVA